MAEALAIFLALQQASELGVKNLHIASDSQQLIKAINGEPPVMELHGILHYILSISLSFEVIRFSFVKRDLNRKADALAKSALDSINGVPVTI